MHGYPAMHGYNWRNRINERKAIKDAVKNYLMDCENVGSPVKLNTLPIAVKDFIKQITYKK